MGDREVILSLARQRASEKHHGVMALARDYTAEVPRGGFCPVEFWDHPNRPVLMLGSRDMRMHAADPTGTGQMGWYAEALFNRYVSLFKVTALGGKGFEEVIQPICLAINKRIPNTKRLRNVADGLHFLLSRNEVAFIDGVRLYFDRDNRNALWGLVELHQKTKKLEAFAETRLVPHPRAFSRKEITNVR